MATLADPAVQRNFIDFRHPDPGCWPLSSLVSFVAKTTYSTVVSSTAWKHGMHPLEFITYIATSESCHCPRRVSGWCVWANSPPSEILHLMCFIQRRVMAQRC
jgi:hypothetical protein